MHSTNSNLGFNNTDVGLTATRCSACLLDVVNTVNKMFIMQMMEELLKINEQLGLARGK